MFSEWVMDMLHVDVIYDMETLSVALALCEENPLVTDGFLSQRASNTQNVVVHLNKRLNNK